MVTFNSMRIQEIVEDSGLSVDEKVEQLREIETEARALARAASESPMNANDGWDDDLVKVRKALDKLGADTVRKGAATL
jgi:CMP-2-keto-3-deoxyoctulosonic acid synthetase